MKLAIIGAGAMGKWFAEFAKNRGLEVIITDSERKKAQETANELGIEFSTDNEEATEDADMVMICVPIKETPKVIEELSDSLKKDSILFDIASVKEDAVAKMEELNVKTELVSMHPLFGPGANTLEGKTIISIPVNDGKRYQELKGLLSDLGAEIIEMEANEHDRLMAVIQSLTHFTLLTYLSALNSMKNSEKAKEFQTPIFKKLLDLSKAFLQEDPKLCGDIQTENKYSSIARSSVLEACRSLDVALKAENVKVIREIFEETNEKMDGEEIELAYEKLYEEMEGE